MGLLDRFRGHSRDTASSVPTVGVGPKIVNSEGHEVRPQLVDLDRLIDSKSIDLVDVNGSSIVVVEAPSHVLHQKPTVSAPKFDKEFVERELNKVRTNRASTHESNLPAIQLLERQEYSLLQKLADPDATDHQMRIELGRTSSSYTKYLREEYNPELRDLAGLQKYDRMRRSDAATRSALKTLKTPILGATWYLQPYDDKPRSREIATFVHRNFTQYMSYPFNQVISEALLMLDFGFYMFEKVWDERQFGRKSRVYLKKMAPRHPMDVVDWIYDANGGPAAVDFYNSPGALDHVRVPIDKLAIFSYDSEAGDMRGISVLRSAYKHWYFAENFFKIDAIQKERHGIGIPVIKLPPGFTVNDRNLAQELGENLRTNEKAHVVLPPYWEVMFAKLEGQPVSPMESAQHHQKMIWHNVMAQALYENVTGSDTDVMTLFYKSTRHLADMVRSVFNKFVIPQIVQPNWGIEDYPELKIRRLGDTKEARTVSFALRNAVGAGIIRVDDDLEEWFRDLMDAPKHNPSTYRPQPAKQAAGGGGPAGGTAQPTQARVGPPRQAPAAGGMQQGKSAGRSNSGMDQSGGG